jgi:hypothetical protein
MTVKNQIPFTAFDRASDRFSRIIPWFGARSRYLVFVVLYRGSARWKK